MRLGIPSKGNQELSAKLGSKRGLVVAGSEDGVEAVVLVFARRCPSENQDLG